MSILQWVTWRKNSGIATISVASRFLTRGRWPTGFEFYLDLLTSKDKEPNLPYYFIHSDRFILFPMMLKVNGTNLDSIQTWLADFSFRTSYLYTICASTYTKIDYFKFWSFICILSYVNYDIQICNLFFNFLLFSGSSILVVLRDYCYN